MRQEDVSNSRRTANQNPLQHVEWLFQQGKLRESLEELDRLEIQEDVMDFNHLKENLHRCRILAHLDVYQAQAIADQVILVSQKQEHPLIQVDALIIMAEAWLDRGMLAISRSLVRQGKDLLTTVSNEKKSNLTEREAILLALEGGIFAHYDKVEPAISFIKKSLTINEKLNIQQGIAHSLYYLGIAFVQQGDHKSALECFQQSLTLREELKIPQEIAYSLFGLGVTYANMGEFESAIKFYQKCLAIREQLGARYGIAHTLSYIGAVYTNKGEWEHAIQIFQKSLAICAQLRIPATFAEAKSLLYLGFIYNQKGEWKQALDSLHKSMNHYEEQELTSQIGLNLLLIGRVYQHQNNLAAAFEYGLKSLRVLEDERNVLLAFNLAFLIEIALEQGSLEFVNQYSHKLKGLRNKLPIKIVDLLHRFTQALILKASTRTRDKMHAQEILKKITEDEIISIEYTVLANLHLCELLFYEFKTSETPEILKEITTITNNLLDLAKAQSSYSLLAQTYLLQAKLELAKLDIFRARRLFTQAQLIADEKGLKKLARSISHEHDILLSQLDRWKQHTEQKTPLVEASDEAGIGDLLTRMVKQRGVDAPELQPEEPVLLMTLTEGGISIFTKKFELGEQLDEQLIGGLLTAIYTFGKDVLEGTETDRIMYRDYTVVFNTKKPFLFCYIFKGPSYSALQKLNQFVELIQPLSGSWKDKFIKNEIYGVSTVIKELNDAEKQELNQIITEIF